MNKTKHDILISGALAGVIGSILQNIFGTAMKSLGLTNRTFGDFAQVLILFQAKNEILHMLVGWFVHFTLGAILGAIYSVIIKSFSHRHYLIKGLGLGLTSWVFLLSFGTFYKMPLFTRIKPIPALLMMVGSSIWGLATAICLKVITKNFKCFYDD